MESNRGLSKTKQKVRTFLWFNDKALEAAEFYTSIFKNSRIQSQSPMIVEFALAGSQYIALNGGPVFQFNESISLFVDCADQAEIDELWTSCRKVARKVGAAG